MKTLLRAFAIVGFVLSALSAQAQEKPVQISGIYPHLAMFNNEGECGTGAVVPWADRLWVVTYAPHSPQGSSDKLYEITPDLKQIVRSESIGGTPANRMLHRESQQLFIGPYAIDSRGNVRAIPYSKMYGRPTGNARHLTDPANKIYYATMEEGLYEVDVKTLAVKELWADEQVTLGKHSKLPGYHGKGLYSAQGRVIYANNGEHGSEAQERPDVASGVLAEWDGQADKWTVVRRNQFTEVTGPNGITGESQPGDPVWSIGWDHRSLILMCLADGKWHSYRLPKASHSYDGAHGWNTEWPRIREIGEGDLLMTMHGMFWKFPRAFTPQNSAGVAPRSTYLKVIGDFCKWNDSVVLGCDDTAKNEFLNKRKAKGEIAAPQSQSNLWFVEPSQLDHLGPVIGRGAVWMLEDVAAATPSDPMLFAGFQLRGLHLSHQTEAPVTITLEVDEKGTGEWRKLRDATLEAKANTWLDLTVEPQATWIRVTSAQPLKRATAMFAYSTNDPRPGHSDPIFDGLAKSHETTLTGGTMRARDKNTRTLHFLAVEPGEGGPSEIGLYELDAALKLRRVDDPAAHEFHRTHAAIPTDVLTADAASIIFVDDSGKRWRLPRGSADVVGNTSIGAGRVCREVATERDLFNAGGSFYELPAENAGGFAKVRAVATHDRLISDYCSYRGLFVMSGVAQESYPNNPHIIRSDDGRTALWVGAIDDVWKLGRPRGFGGPWKDSPVKANVPSDPYLLTGFDKKTLTLAHDAKTPVRIRIECDVTGTGVWQIYREFDVAPGKTETHEVQEAFSAYWLRAVTSSDCTATVQLKYE